MIVIKENILLRDKLGGNDTKKTMPCFKCGTEHIFFGISPIMCWKCNQILPNGRLLFTSDTCRLSYHKATGSY